MNVHKHDDIWFWVLIDYVLTYIFMINFLNFVVFFLLFFDTD